MWRRGGLASALAATMLIVSACKGAPHQSAQKVAEAPASALLVRAVDAPDYKTVAAVLTNRDVGDARARIGGTVQQLVVREGEQVRRGQLVAIVADQRLALEAQAGNAATAAAEALAVQARSDLKRTQYLFERGIYAQARLDAVTAQANAADAQLRAARAQAGAAGAVANQGRVYAPADGRVTREPIPQGAVVLPGDIVVAISTGARVLRIEVPEGQAGFLREGQEIRILGEEGAAARKARIRQVYPAVANGLVTADLDAAHFDGDFIGERVRVLVPAGTRRAFVVPARFVVTRFGVDYVRLWRNGAVIEAPVQRGAATPMDGAEDAVEILSGLHEGDRIVPAGAGA